MTNAVILIFMEVVLVFSMQNELQENVPIEITRNRNGDMYRIRNSSGDCEWMACSSSHSSYLSEIGSCFDQAQLTDMCKN